MPNSKTATDPDPTETNIPEPDATPDILDGIDEGDSSDVVASGVAKKSPLGAKEVPPFEWKLLGTVNYATLTLFKSVDRADSEAQLERVQRDGYYKDLRIVGVNDKVVQPKLPAAMRKKAAALAKKAAGASGKSARKSTKAARQSNTIKIVLKKVDKKSVKKKTSKKPVKKVTKKAVKKTAKIPATTKKKKAAPAKKTAARKPAVKKSAKKKVAPKKSRSTKKTGARKTSTKKK